MCPNHKEPMEREPSELERRVSEALTEGEMAKPDSEQAVRERLIHPYEYRIQAELDPIVEETIRIRRMAREVDDRYDQYMERAGKQEQSESRMKSDEGE